jgi:hypothetical protein
MEIRLLTQEDVQHYKKTIFECFEICYGEAPKEEEFDAKYFANPYKNKIICAAAIRDETVFGLVFYIPNIHIYNGKQFKAVQDCDVMVRPDANEIMLLLRLRKKLMEYLRSEKYVLLIGFPNQMTKGISLTGHLGDKLALEFDYYSFFFKIPFAILRLKKFFKGQNITKNISDNLSVFTDDDFAMMQKNGDCRILPERKFFEFKFSKKRGNYKFLKIEKDDNILYTVYKIEKRSFKMITANSLNLVYFHFTKKPDLSLLSASFYAMRKEGFFITMYEQYNEEMKKLLSQLKMKNLNKLPLGLEEKTLTINVFNENYNELDDIKNWDLQWYETDI